MSSSSKHKVFISGPMTGIEKYNFPEFDRWEHMLRESGGYEVINPANIARKHKVSEVLAHEDVFKKMVDEELAELATCSHIFLLDGWEKSNGARKEAMKALELGLKIVLQHNACQELGVSRNPYENGSYDIFRLKVKNVTSGKTFELEQYGHSKQEIESFWAEFEAGGKTGEYHLVSCEGPVKRQS